MSFNVNGLRACQKNLDGGFEQFLATHQPDILCLQEVKCDESQIPPDFPSDPSYHRVFHGSTAKKGYSGTMVLSKIKPESTSVGMPGVQDNEGRVITVEYPKFYLVNTYIPNSGQSLERLGYRTKNWNPKMLAYLLELRKKKPVVWTGYLNVAYLDIDVYAPEKMHRVAGFTDEERADMATVLNSGFIDVYRALYPTEEDNYTFWSHFANNFERNNGWRLDYFVISPDLSGAVVDVQHLRFKSGGKRPSDHCPIALYLQL